jgi:dihydrodipicolinate synthase/N-acetylneuraminate lyase
LRIENGELKMSERKGETMLRGVLLPIITPFDDHVRVDEQMMRQLVDFHIKAGVQGLFVAGSTGQGPAMTIDERKETAAIALDQAKKRVPVVIHIGTADAWSTTELAEHAAARGADAVAIVPPYYYSDHTEFEIMAHYKAVHKAVPLPIYIYENPKYSGISIPPGFAVRMKEQVPALKGIKVAYGQGALLEYVRLLPDVSIFTGNADLFGLVPFGLAGMINPPTSFVPELCVDLFTALGNEDYPRAVQAQKKLTPRRASSPRGCANTAACRCKSLSHARFCGENVFRNGKPSQCRKTRSPSSSASCATTGFWDNKARNL